MRPIITLTTDFGLHDSYVGVMKGVILGICPDAHLVDITHTIPPQNILAAAHVVQTLVPYFPSGSIHVVVVDPGVGSRRRAVALETPQARFVGPDNGVFGLIWRDAGERWSAEALRAVTLQAPRFWRPQVSATFHGRDIFAPVAAHLASGIDLSELGPPVNTLQSTPAQEPTWADDGSLNGLIVYVDHFGNCISNITTTHLERFGPLQHVNVIVGSQWIGPIHHTYADVAAGAALALIGSSGRLEVALRNGNASQELGIGLGQTVRVARTATTSGSGANAPQYHQR